MIKRVLVIQNRLGLHARASARFCKVVERYPEDDVVLEYMGKRASGNSIMGQQMLALSRGTEVTVYVNGPNEQELMECLETLVNERFNED